MQDVLDVQRDHPRLIAACMQLLSKRGELVFSTNLRHFELDPGVSDTYRCEDMHQWSVPEDFRSHTIHRCWRVGHRR